MTGDKRRDRRSKRRETEKEEEIIDGRWNRDVGSYRPSVKAAASMIFCQHLY